MASAQRAMTNLADDTEAMKHNFFLRGFFKKRGFYDLSNLTPAQYRTVSSLRTTPRNGSGSTAVRSFRPRQKVRTNCPRRGGQEVDQAMADFVPDLPNRPIVVEGYSGRGSAAERFRRSQQYARTLQRYLQTRFKLAAEPGGRDSTGRHPAEVNGESSSGTASRWFCSRESAHGNHNSSEPLKKPFQIRELLRPHSRALLPEFSR